MIITAQTRPERAQAQIGTAQTRIQEINNLLKNGRESGKPLSEERRALLDAEIVSLNAQIELRRQELAGNSQLQDLGKARRDLLAERIARAENPGTAGPDQREAPRRIGADRRRVLGTGTAGRLGQAARRRERREPQALRLPAARHRAPQPSQPAEPADPPAARYPQPDRSGAGGADLGARGQPAAVAHPLPAEAGIAEPAAGQEPRRRDRRHPPVPVRAEPAPRGRWQCQRLCRAAAGPAERGGCDPGAAAHAARPGDHPQRAARPPQSRAGCAAQRLDHPAAEPEAAAGHRARAQRYPRRADVLDSQQQAAGSQLAAGRPQRLKAQLASMPWLSALQELGAGLKSGRCSSCRCCC